MSKLDTVMIGEYEYRTDILGKLQRCFHTAVNDHCKVIAVRLDIRVPIGFQCDDIGKKFDELLRRTKLRFGYYKIDCRYVGVQEQDQSSHPHIHLLLLLDGSRIERGWGVWDVVGNIWSTILKCDAKACVHLCLLDQGMDSIMIRRPSSRSDGEKFLEEVAQFERAYHYALAWSTYLAKTATKGEGRQFRCSRF